MQQASIVAIHGSREIVGCGFAVTPRHILTCAHVVKAAYGLKEIPQRLPSNPIEVSFPFLDGSPVKAKVVYWKPDFYDMRQLPPIKGVGEEDIAGLELLETVPGVLPVELKLCGDNLSFKAFGYPKKTSQGAIAEGKIQGAIPFGWVQIDGSGPEGFWVAPGYSGTAIWDLQNGSDVYGMMVAVRKEDEMASRIAYMIPYKGLGRAIASLKLLELLPQPESLESSLWESYQSVYSQCSPPDWNLASASPESLGDILMQLSNMGSSTLEIDGETVDRIWEFVARLLGRDTTLLENQKESLREWGKQQSPKFLELLDAIRTENEVAPSQRQEVRVASPRLIIEIAPNKPPYGTRAFFIPDSDTYDPNDYETWKEVLCWDFQQKREKVEDLAPIYDNFERELQCRLAGYIKTCEKRYQRDRQFQLELILPSTLMNLPIDSYELEYGTYEGILVPGSTFPVVVRSYDRTTEEYWDELGEQWEEQWRRFQHNAQSTAHQCLAEVIGEVQVHQLRAKFYQPEVVGFRLCEVLQAPVQEKFLGALLGSAAPIAIWLRYAPQQTSETVEQVRLYLNELLGCDCPPACVLAELPGKTFGVRAAAVAARAELSSPTFQVGDHLSLLWENPNLRPPTAPKHISE